MRSAIFALAILASTIKMLAQAPALGPGKAAKPDAALCTVSGRVVTAADGSPLKSARVALMRDHVGSGPRMYAATSDRDGRFNIQDIDPGRYEFLAIRTGYVDQPYQSQGTDSPVLALQAGQQLSDVLFRLKMASVIAGHVSNEDGEGMAHVQVVALRKPSEAEISEEGLPASRKPEPRAVASAQTDDRGQYRIFGLEPGEYYIKATQSFESEMNIPVGQDYFIQQFLGSDYAPVFYPAVPQLGQAQAIAVSAGEEAQVELVMREVRTVEISGRVIGADGTLIDASINLVGDDYGSEQYAFTDANGNFSLKHIPPGSYVLFAFQRTHDDKTYRAQQKLEIGNDNIDSLVLVLGGGTNFSGRITVLGSPSVRRERLYISLTPIGEGGSSGNSSHAKKDGTFEITDVKEGSYAIFVGGPDEGWYTKSVRLGSDDVLANGLQVEKGSFGGTLEIVISTGTALLEGSVTCNDKPLIGAHVHLALDPESPYNKMRSATVSTDQNGHFSVQVAPGKYQVVARSSGLTGETAVTSDPRTVTLSEQEHKTIQLTIAPQTK